jgi:hypothetical protein
LPGGLKWKDFLPISSRISYVWFGIFELFFLGQFLLIVIGAVPIALVEKIPFGDALYFAFVTGLTIGYGDIVMKTTLGRCIALLLGFIGILFTGLVIAAAVEAVRKTYHPQ